MTFVRLSLLSLAGAGLLLAVNACSTPEPETPNPHATPAPQRQFDPASDRYQRQPPFGERGNRG